MGKVIKVFNILFVDDDISLRYIISKMKVWKYSEFHIKKQAKNGEEALNFLESDDFDLVITDIRMPI
jgi:two-component system response regulator YesN